MASTLTRQLYSRSVWMADGVDTIWDFQFTGGYIDKSHIRAWVKLPNGDIEELPLNIAVDLIGPFQLRIVPAVPAGYELTIARDTPKDLPIVNFEDGAQISEISLDTNAKQAVFIASESIDSVLVGLTEAELDPDFGYKSLKHLPYSGASEVQVGDNGRSHYKSDGTAVTVPNTLKDEFLSTIINDSDSIMAVSFPVGGAILQGSPDITPYVAWQLSPRQLLSITKMPAGHWFISGKVDRL